MGLEGVELVMAMEEEFEIVIEDEEAQSIITPKDAIELISNKVNTTNDKTCLSQKYFHKLRKYLEKELKLNRVLIKLDLDITDCVPPNKQKEAWKNIGNEFEVEKMPHLKRPSWLVNLIWSLSFLAGISYAFFYSFAIGLLSFVTISSIGFIITMGLRNQIHATPIHPKRVSKMVKKVQMMLGG